MKNYRFKVQFIINDVLSETGYYQLVRISDDAILATRENFRTMVNELDARMIAGVTYWE